MRMVGQPVVRIALGMALAGAVSLACSCASSPKAQPVGSDGLVAPPEDFGLHVLTMSGGAMPPAVGSGAPGAGSQFMVSADGVFRAERAPEASVNTVPPIVRTLTRRQMADLWSLLGQIGLTDPKAGMEPQNPALLAAEVSGPTTMVTLKASDHVRFFVASHPENEQGDPVTAQLLEHLRALAWFDDDDNEHATIQPIRYDFGPDPYARYRTGGTAATQEKP